MGRLTTRVIDTASGMPAPGIVVTVTRLDAEEGPIVVATAVTNDSGRTNAPLLEGKAFLPGRYEVSFAVGVYFATRSGDNSGIEPTIPPFLDEVPIRVGLAENDGDYHLPLLVSPWSYATYRGC
jgi:5-hydroxyisourate hydrolase